MRKTVVIALSALVAFSVLVVCMSFCCSNSGIKGEDITFYEYHIGNGYSGQSYEYSIYLKDSVVIASVKMCNMLMMREDTIPCEEHVVSDVPREKLVQVGKLLLDAKVQKWENFYTNPDVFDGDNWSMSARFGKISYHSSGYMNWPDKAPFREINGIIAEVCLPKE